MTRRRWPTTSPATTACSSTRSKLRGGEVFSSHRRRILRRLPHRAATRSRRQWRRSGRCSMPQWSTPNPLRVRMAVHAGAAEHRAGNWFGPTLNRTSRLLATAAGGQVVCSQVAVDLSQDELPPGIGLIDLGEHRLADLSRPGARLPGDASRSAGGLPAAAVTGYPAAQPPRWPSRPLSAGSRNSSRSEALLDSCPPADAGRHGRRREDTLGAPGGGHRSSASSRTVPGSSSWRPVRDPDLVAAEAVTALGFLPGGLAPAGRVVGGAPLRPSPDPPAAARARQLRTRRRDRRPAGACRAGPVPGRHRPGHQPGGARPAGRGGVEGPAAVPAASRHRRPRGARPLRRRGAVLRAGQGCPTGFRVERRQCGCGRAASAAASTASPSVWNWRRPRSASSAPTRSPSGSTTASGCWPEGPGRRCPASRRCGRRWIGASSCSHPSSRSCSGGWSVFPGTFTLATPSRQSSGRLRRSRRHRGTVRCGGPAEPAGGQVNGQRLERGAGGAVRAAGDRPGVRRPEAGGGGRAGGRSEPATATSGLRWPTSGRGVPRYTSGPRGSSASSPNDGYLAAMEWSLAQGDHEELLRLAAAYWPYWYWTEAIGWEVWLEEALARCQTPSPARVQALIALAALLRETGQEPDRWDALMEEAMENARRLESDTVVAQVLFYRSGLGLGGTMPGRRGDAPRGPAIWESTGLETGIGWCHFLLGLVALAEEDPDRAARHLEISWRTGRGRGRRHHAGPRPTRAAMVAALQGDRVAARASAGRGDQGRRRVNRGAESAHDGAGPSGTGGRRRVTTRRRPPSSAQALASPATIRASATGLIPLSNWRRSSWRSRARRGRGASSRSARASSGARATPAAEVQHDRRSASKGCGTDCGAYSARKGGRPRSTRRAR